MAITLRAIVCFIVQNEHVYNKLQKEVDGAEKLESSLNISHTRRVLSSRSCA